MDSLAATATIFYSMSNTNHAMAWLHEYHSNTEHCKRILKEFSVSWRYVMADLAGMCRHEVLLTSFGENSDTDTIIRTPIIAVMFTRWRFSYKTCLKS